MPSIFEATAGKLIGPTNGGSVTQATNKSTAVTLNTESGVITTNNAALADAAEVTFQVNKVSTKKEIKLAIENIFQVKVKKVNTSIVKGKLKSFRGSLGKRSDYKKAFVTLEDGQTIDIIAGV